MRRIALGLLLASMFSLAQAAPKGVTIKTSGFNGVKEVSLKPYGTSSCLSSGSVCISVGAFWKDDSKDYVALDLMSLNTFVNMTNLTINIDGNIINAERVNFGGEHKLTGVYQQSTQRFVVSRDVFEKILSAKKVWLKIDTMNASSIETNLIENGKETLGFQGLKRFSTEIN